MKEIGPEDTPIVEPTTSPLGLRRENVLVCDSRGVIYQGREENMERGKASYAQDTDKRSLAEANLDLAYETLEEGGHTPLLTPMSEIAGRMAPMVGAFYLQRPRGGSGLLPCGVPGVPPARALILGSDSRPPRRAATS